jgi:hypothetical protein
VGDNPYGPFTFQGEILTPVVGWTTHHSIVEFKGKWYLFFHDSVPSGGRTWLRSMKVVELNTITTEKSKRLKDWKTINRNFSPFNNMKPFGFSQNLNNFKHLRMQHFRHYILLFLIIPLMALLKTEVSYG